MTLGASCPLQRVDDEHGQKSKKDKETNPDIFLSMGIECYKDILKNNSQETINKIWGELVSKLELWSSLLQPIPQVAEVVEE